MRLKRYCDIASTILLRKNSSLAALILVTLSLTVYHYANRFMLEGGTRSSTPVVTTSKSSSYYELAKHESFGFFDDIEESSWKLYQERARSDTIYKNPDDPNAGVDQSGTMWQMFNVDPIFTCPHLFRVGGRGDGPKWTCDPHRLTKQPDCLIYSVGSAGVYLFEDGIVDMQRKQQQPKHCEIHVFDPNPKFERPNDKETKNIHYHAWGLKSSYEAGTGNMGNLTFMSLPETLETLGHVGRRIDIFKIDCEGCEWFSFKDWLDPSVDIRQILIETHLAERRQYATPSQFFDRFLDRGFVPFSKETNTHPGATPLGELVEWGFVRFHPDFLQRGMDS